MANRCINSAGFADKLELGHGDPSLLIFLTEGFYQVFYKCIYAQTKLTWYTILSLNRALDLCGKWGYRPGVY